MQSQLFLHFLISQFYAWEIRPTNGAKIRYSRAALGITLWHELNSSRQKLYVKHDLNKY